MYLKSTLLTGMMVCAMLSMAQTGGEVKPVKKSCSCAFSSINQAGLIIGERGSYVQVQTINGIRYKTWFAGLGVGIDYYTDKGYPVFIDVRKDVFNKRYTPFLYADGGIHFADVNNKKEDQLETTFNNGFYYDTGAGYKAGFTKKGGLLISAGFSYKYVIRRLSSKFCGFTGCSQSSYIYTNHLNRFSVKVGWAF
jgi:hypothetical protein